MYKPWLIRYLADWKPFHHILFGQSALVVILAPLFGIHESGRWLLTQGRVDECEQIMRKIAKGTSRHYICRYILHKTNGIFGNVVGWLLSTKLL